MERVEDEANTSKEHIWSRKAFTREHLLSTREKGAPRFPCFLIKITSSTKLTHDHFNTARKHLITKTKCFPFRMAQRTDRKEVWIKKETRFSTTLSKVPYEKYKTLKVIEDMSSEDDDRDIFKIHYVNLKNSKKKSRETMYKCKLILSFHTGMYDEFSCALITNIFIDILDGNLLEREYKDFSYLKLYEDGYHIEEAIVIEKSLFDQDESLKKKFVQMYEDLLKRKPCNFTFPIDEQDKNVSSKYKHRLMSFSKESTLDLFCLCKEVDASVYTTIYSAINSSILYLAHTCGFEGNELNLNVMHKINGKYGFKPVTKENLVKLGFHTIPILQHVAVNREIQNDILRNAELLEAKLVNFIPGSKHCTQEALRQMVIEKNGEESLTKLIPRCFFTLSNLGDMDQLIHEQRLKLTVCSVGRANVCHEWSQIDFTFYTSRGKLIMSADFCTDRLSEVHAENILDIFFATIESLL